MDHGPDHVAVEADIRLVSTQSARGMEAGTHNSILLLEKGYRRLLGVQGRLWRRQSNCSGCAGDSVTTSDDNSVLSEKRLCSMLRHWDYPAPEYKRAYFDSKNHPGVVHSR